MWQFKPLRLMVRGNLQTLDVSDCQGFFELSFLELLDKSMALQCPVLTELTVNGFSTLTDACLRAVFSLCPMLELVDIQKSCTLLTAET
eukprot:gene39002-48165_t